MDVLVIGGSVFLGRAVVAEALAAGARVSVVNRGLSGGQPDAVEQLLADRTEPSALEQLRGRHFDLVIDTCGYVPAEVRLTAEVLAPSCGRYVFVSSINAYPGWPAEADYRAGGVYDGDPDAGRSDVPERFEESQANGWLKVGCERTVQRAFGADRTTVLRGGCIVGPHDGAVGRLPWWIDRVARGGEVLVPGAADAPVALIDARDLARFALTCAAGVFEAAGPSRRDTRADLMRACLDATGSDASFTYVQDEWLRGQAVQAWTELPLWIAAADGPGVFAHHGDEAVGAGLRWRPLIETVRDTWAWQQSVPGGWRPSPRTPGLAAERERALLQTWHAR